MQIIGSRVVECRRHIPLKGWESVENALNLYASGQTAGSHDPEKVTIKALGRDPSPGAGLGVAMFVVAGAKNRSNTNGMVSTMLTEAKKALVSRTEWSKSYDYDGMGTPFFKAGVAIDVIDRKAEMFALGIWAAYVGDKPEAGLAAHLGIPRLLARVSVAIETEKLPGDRFEFDFDVILSKLKPLFPEKRLEGARVVAALMECDPEGGDGVRIELGAIDGFTLTLRPGNVERRWCYTRSGKRETWSVAGSTLSGELARDYEAKDENSKATPTLVIDVQSAEMVDMGYKKEPKNLWCTSDQARAVALAERVAALFR